MVDVVGTETPLNEEDFSLLERKLNYPIPKEFVDFYMVRNGGFLDEADVEAGLWGLPIGGFNPIRHGRVTIESLIDDYGDISVDENAWIKGDYIPFAYDNGGNLIFLSLSDGGVYFCAVYDDVLSKITDSFCKFIDKLYQNGTQTGHPL